MQEDLLVKIAWYYYFDGLTQDQIAKKLGMYRMKVNKLLNEARERGILEIKIKSSKAGLIGFSERVKRATGLEDVVVVPRGENLLGALASGVVHYLETTPRKLENLGIGSGKTLQRVPQYIESDSPATHKITNIYALLGNAKPNMAMNPNNIGIALAQKLNADFFSIFAPALTQSEEEAKMIRNNRFVASVLKLSEKADLALVGLGGVQKSSWIDMDFISEEELSQIRKLGAVGEIFGRYFDIDGNRIETSIDKRIIALSIPMKCFAVAAAGGEEKVKAIVGAIRGRFIDGLITDEETGRAVISYFQSQEH